MSHIPGWQQPETLAPRLGLSFCGLGVLGLVLLLIASFLSGWPHRLLWVGGATAILFALLQLQVTLTDMCRFVTQLRYPTKGPTP